MAYIGKEPAVGNFQVCDAISVVNGQAAYTMQVSSTNVVPESANHMLVSLNGILQKPNSSFTVSGSTITFASNLATGDVIDFIMLLGNVLDIGTPSDSTVTNAKTNFVSTSSAAGLDIKGDGTTDGTLRLLCSQGTHGVKIASPSHSAGQSYTLTLPTGNVTAGKFLKVDSVSGSGTTGNGQLSFADAGGSAGELSFRVTKSSAQTISSGSSTVITFDTETFDIGGAFASNKFTVPSGKDGVYFFHFEVITNENIGGSKFQASIRVNGSGVSFSANSGGSGSYRAGITTSALANLSAGDYVDCDVFQQHGTVTVSGGSFCTFQGFRVS